MRGTPPVPHVIHLNQEMSWKHFEQANPQLAAFGHERLHRRVCYLATVRKDGSPRVHPVSPLISDGHLLVFMEPTSPKGHDLRRDGRYALHSSVADNDGTGGEFTVAGRARLVQSPALRMTADAAHGTPPRERWILFEFEVEMASSTVYQDDSPVRVHWQH
jgi:hypothetical protein